MLSTDQEKGRAILITASVIFLYYTMWVIGLPFIDDTRVKSLFYSHNIALMVPAVCGLCFIGGLVVFTAYHLKPYLGTKVRDR